MNWGGLVESFEQIWEHRPWLILLLLFGFAVFLFIVSDAWRHKHRHHRARKRAAHQSSSDPSKRPRQPLQ